MNLQFYKWNNYYNRTYKPFSLAEASNALVGSILNVNGFNPNDGVDTEQMTGLNTFTEIPNYCVVVEGTEIISKWFVIECQRTRQGQYKLSLHRDLISDYYQELMDAPVFIEKGFLPYSNPLIFNRESMTFNRVKKAEVLLKDDTYSPWLVAYVGKASDGSLPQDGIKGSITDTAPNPDFTVTSLDQYEYYIYAQSNPNRQNFFVGIYNTIYGVYSKVGVEPGKAFKYTYGERYPIDWVGTVVDNNTNNSNIDPKILRSNYYNYRDALYAALVGQVDAKSTTAMSNLISQAGKIIRVGAEAPYKYYQVSVESQQYNEENFLSAGILYNVMSEWVTSAQTAGGVRIDDKTLSYQVDTTSYSIILRDITSNVSASFTYTTAKQQLVDAPYAMVVAPYNDLLFQLTINGVRETITVKADMQLEAMSSFVNNGQTFVYDFQLLPYCPISGIEGVDDATSGINLYMTDPSEKSYSLIKDSEGANHGIVFYAQYSKFSKQIPMSSNSAYDYLTKVVKNPIERKVKNECELVRIASPNGSNSFDFSPQLNDGFDYIQVDCTYKPYSPYIRVAPDFAGLYGDNFGDTRGLIVQGDFSLPVITDQWKQYEINNKNYANVFDRETQSLELKEHYRRIQSGAGIVAGALGAAGTGTALGSAGGPVGMAVGAVVGGAASVAGGIADYTISKRLYEDNMSYRQDMYSMNLENIQARPNGLAKTSAFTNNNKIYPFIEFYSATDTEKEAFRNKLLYNGMTVGVIGNITDYIGSKVGSESHHYIKGQLIQIDVSDDYHTCQAINNEINMGIRFPV